MHLSRGAVSLNVADEVASARFLEDQFGFQEEMSSPGFVSLAHPDVTFNVIFLRVGLATFKPDHLRGRHADGLLLVFVVEDVDREYERLVGAGLPIVTPIETEPWGERYFQVADPNGLVIQLVQWVDPPDAEP